MWAPVMDRLAPERDVVALDLPGFGESLPLPATAPSVPELARSVARSSRSSASSARTWPATRSAARVALELGAMGAVRSVCALSPAGFASGWESATRSRRCGSCGRSRGRWRRRPAGWRAAGDAPRHLVAARRAPGARAAGRDGRRVAQPRPLARLPGHPARRQDWSELDGRPADVPTTIAWGEHDRLLLYRPQSARARAALPAARHVTLSGCGHVPTWDDPEQVAAGAAGRVGRLGVRVGVRRRGPAAA